MIEPELSLGNVDLFKRNSITMKISREMALDYGLLEPTPEESADRERDLAEFRAKCVAAWDGYDQTTAELAALDSPGVRAVLDLHAADETGWSVRCAHCWRDTEMGDLEEWPCETVRVVADAFGIALPPMTLYTDSRA